MGLLDLLGGGSLSSGGLENRSFNNDLIDNYLNSQVAGVTEKGIVLEVPDTRVGTTLAARAAFRTNGGQLPAGIGQRTRLIPFEGPTGKQTLDRLTKSGIGAGSTIGDLYGALNGTNDNPFTRSDQQFSRGPAANLRRLLSDAFDGDGTFNGRQTGNLFDRFSNDTQKADQSLITDQTYRGDKVNRSTKQGNSTRANTTNDKGLPVINAGDGIFSETTDNPDLLGIGNYLESLQREITPMLTKYNF